LSLCLITHQALKTYARVKAQLHVFIGTGCRWLVSFIVGDRSPVPIRQDAGYTPEPVCMLWRGEQYLSLAGNRFPTLRLYSPYRSHSTDSAIESHKLICFMLILDLGLFRDAASSAEVSDVERKGKR
jgi:hypothetical protein